MITKDQLQKLLEEKKELANRTATVYTQLMGQINLLTTMLEECDEIKKDLQ